MRPDAGRGEVEADGTSEPARADDQHRCRLELLLPRLTDLGEDEFGGSSERFGVGEHVLVSSSWRRRLQAATG